MSEFSPGDRVRDKDRDEGVIVVAEPDSVGEIVWRCDHAGSKQAILGAYYQSPPSDLSLLPSTISVTVELDRGDAAEFAVAWCDPGDDDLGSTGRVSMPSFMSDDWAECSCGWRSRNCSGPMVAFRLHAQHRADPRSEP